MGYPEMSRTRYRSTEPPLNSRWLTGCHQEPDLAVPLLQRVSAACCWESPVVCDGGHSPSGKQWAPRSARAPTRTEAEGRSCAMQSSWNSDGAGTPIRQGLVSDLAAGCRFFLLTEE